MNELIREALDELYASCQTFRNLGFGYDQVEVCHNILDPGMQPFWGICLKAQGNEFNFHVVPKAVIRGAGLSDEEFLSAWNEFLAQVNAKPPIQELHARLKPVVEGSFAWRNKVQLSLALIRKGITPPAMVE